MRKILPTFLNKIRGIANDKRGNVAITFVLSSTVALSLVGFGIDYSRATNAREKLQWAVDGAALTAKRTHLDTRRAKGETLSKTYSVTQGNNVFKSNVATVSGWLKDGTAQATFAWGSNDAAQVTGTAKVSTLFGGLIGYSAVDIKAYAEVGLGQSIPVEVSLVLDNTASMFTKDNTGTTDSRMTLLRNAAKKFVNTLFDAANRPDIVRVAVVPWTTTVNVLSEKPLAWNTSGKQENVIADKGSRTVVSTGLIDRALTVSYTADNYTPTNWRGCISGSGETSGYTDTAKSGKFTALNIPRKDPALYTGYISPIYTNNYFVDGECLTRSTTIKDCTADCTDTPKPSWCNSTCTSCDCPGYPACACTSCGCAGQPACDDGEPAGFMPKAPAVPITLRNIAPNTLKSYQNIFPVETCEWRCTQYEKIPKTNYYCSRINKFTYPTCSQSLSRGLHNIYIDNGSSPNDFCVTRLDTTADCPSCIYDQCDKTENWSFQSLGTCISDPNEVTYNNSGGKWCPWVSSAVKNWDSFSGSTPIVGPNINCPIPMLGLSGNRTQVLDTLDRMSPAPHGTHADVGLRWGMRSLSPDVYWTDFFGLGTRPAEPWASERGKVMILITDGSNELAKDIPGYWGCKKTLTDSTDCSSTLTAADLDTRMKGWCKAIRDKGVTLWGILLNNTTNTAATNLMEACAPGKSYSIDSSQLDQLLKDIVEGTILKLYLRK